MNQPNTGGITNAMPQQANQNAMMGQGQPQQRPITESMTPKNAGPVQLDPRLVDLMQKEGFFKAAAEDARRRMEQAGANNALMQQGGPPPTIAQQMEQQMAQMQQQRMAQMQPPQPQAPMPQMASGGIVQLPSRLDFKAGGIVGFSGEEGSHVKPGLGQVGDMPEGFDAGNLYKQAIAQAEAEPDGPSAMDIFKKVLVALKLRRPEGDYGLPKNQRGQGFDDPRIVKPEEGIAALANNPADIAKPTGKGSGSGSTSTKAKVVTASSAPTPAAAEAPDSFWEKENKDTYAKDKLRDPRAEARAAAEEAYRMGGAGLREKAAAETLAQMQAAQEKSTKGAEEANSAFGIKGLGAFLRAGAMAKPATNEGGWTGALSVLGQASEGAISAREKAAATALANDKELIALRAKVTEAKAMGLDQQAAAFQKQLESATEAKARALQSGIQVGTQHELKREQIKSTEKISADNLAARLLQIQQQAENVRLQSAARGSQKFTDTVNALRGQLSSLDGDIKGLRGKTVLSPMEKQELQELTAGAATVRQQLNELAVGTSGGKVTPPPATGGKLPPPKDAAQAAALAKYGVQ
jgi:hypothetical protein